MSPRSLRTNDAALHRGNLAAGTTSRATATGGTTGRGRKTGSKLATLAWPLEQRHFKLLHAVAQGLDVQAASARYADPEGLPADKRHVMHEFGSLVARVAEVAKARGVADKAEIALEGLKGLQVARAGAAAVSSRARTAAKNAGQRRRQAGALRELSDRLIAPPAPNDGLAAWLAADLPPRFMQAQMDGKTTPLVSLGNLVSFVSLQGHRWWRLVPRLGADRADRIMEWLVPVAQAMGTPIHERSLKKLALQRIGRENQLDLVPAQQQRSFGLVELCKLSVPRELDGRDGVFRSSDVNTMGAATDVEAIHVWLNRFKEKPRTQRLYTQVIERFYLWCLLTKRKPMSSIDEQDMMDYKDFLLDPPVDWVQERQTPRGSKEWRPLRGRLSTSTTKLNMSIIASLFGELQKAGYLRAHAAGAVKHSLKLPHMAINIKRSFTEAQWAHVMACWAERYAACGPQTQTAADNVTLPTLTNADRAPYLAALLRRTRLLLELCASTGLRLSEIVTTRRSAMEPLMVDGEEVTMLCVIGKGNKIRKVVLFDDVRELLEQHHNDMDARDTAFEPGATRIRSLHGAGAHLARAKPALAHLPLIGALRKPPKKWVRGRNGVPELAGGELADRFGALDPSALYQGLKRFLGTCADAADKRGQRELGDGLRIASTHWLRHYFANSAAADGVDGNAIRDAMGHASLTTTSIYLHSETKRMVRELSKLRRK